MPGKVTLVFEAQTAEAVARVQQFARGVQQTFDTFKRGDGALQRASVSARTFGGAVEQAQQSTSLASGFLARYAGSHETASEAVGRHGSALGAMGRHMGIITSAMPGASGALGGFVAILQGASPALAGMAVALGLLIERTVDIRTKSVEYIAAANQVTTAIANQRASVLASVRALEADLTATISGSLQDRVRALDAASGKELSTIENARRSAVTAAQDEYQKKIGILDDFVAFFGTKTRDQVAAEQLLRLTIEKEDQLASLSQRERARSLAAEKIKLNLEVANAWRESEGKRYAEELDLAAQVRTQLRADASERLAAAATAEQATANRLAAEAEFQSHALAALQVRAGAEQAAITEELRTFVAGQQAKIQAAQDAADKIARTEGASLATIEAAQDNVGRVAEQANALIAAKTQEAADKSATAWTGFAQRTRAEFESLTANVLGILATLGPGLEGATARLDLTAATQAAASQVRVLDDALRAGLLTNLEYDQAVDALGAQLWALQNPALVAQDAMNAMALSLERSHPSYVLVENDLDRLIRANYEFERTAAAVAEAMADRTRSIASSWDGVTVSIGSALSLLDTVHNRYGPLNQIGPYAALTEHGIPLRGAPTNYWVPGNPGNVAPGVPTFQQGGVVPGSLGTPTLALVHGGETVTPAGKNVGHTFTFHITGDDPKAIAREVAREIEDLRRRGAL